MSEANEDRAKKWLEDKGISGAWQVWTVSHAEAELNCWYDSVGARIRKYDTCRDILSRLIQHGTLSEKQESYLRSLVEDLWGLREMIQKRQEEWDKQAEMADPVPEGRVEVVGYVQSLKWKDTDYGRSLKMLVVSDDGYRVYGSVPKSLVDELDKTDRIRFTATLEPSNDDEKFGFFKRPSKAEILGA